MKTFTKLTFVACLMLLQAVAFAQFSKIAVSHNGASSFYTTLNAAITAAVAEDTIYLPGGAIQTTGVLLIDKKLTIVGAGHYPDSTTSTYQTKITAVIRILTGADGGSLSGVRCSDICFGSNSSNNNVNNYTIQRCYLENLTPTDYTGSTSSNIFIKENVIQNISNHAPFQSVIFLNNIFQMYVYYGFPAIFFNNIIYINCNGISPFQYSSFINNIIIVCECSSANLGGANGCAFSNNLFCGILPNYYAVNWGNNINNNNLTTELATNTFVNATTGNFSYANDYHLKLTSPGVNFGTDGHDVGIYGSDEPYKDGAVPFNPHIISKNIGTSLSPTGNISVDIKVSAQDK